MKNYLKPQLDIKAVQNIEKISSLADWLESGAGSAYAEAGITTYLIES